MNKQEFEKIQKQLWASDEDAVIMAMNHIKKIGDARFFNDLVEHFAHHDSPEVRALAFKLLCGIKDENCVDLFIAAIGNSKYAAIKQDLLSACWQTGLDFSAHIEEFIDLTQHSDYYVALEAFTVIEHSMENVESKSKEDALKHVNLNIHDTDGEKHIMLNELVRVISDK